MYVCVPRYEGTQKPPLHGISFTRTRDEHQSKSVRTDMDVYDVPSNEIIVQIARDSFIYYVAGAVDTLTTQSS